jgi:hypothetical protein
MISIGVLNQVDVLVRLVVPLSSIVPSSYASLPPLFKNGKTQAGGKQATNF